jgi:hypothetical protein
VLNTVVGPVIELQHTPRSVTVAPPSEVIFPPLEAKVAAVFVTGTVDKIGAVKGSFFLQLLEIIINVPMKIARQNQQDLKLFMINLYLCKYFIHFYSQSTQYLKSRSLMIILENLLLLIIKRIYRHTNILKLNLKTTTSKEKVQLP